MDGMDGMTIEQIRTTLIGAFDRSSRSDQAYIARMALSLAVDEEETPAKIVIPAAKCPPSLRLVSSARLLG